MNLFHFHSNRFEEYKQRHLERKAAALKELGLSLPGELFASATVKAGEKSLDKETGSGKEAEDGGSPAVENNSEQSVDEVSVVGAAAVTVNGHVVEPAEQNKHEEKPENREEGDRATEVKMVNGESEVRAAGEEAESSVEKEVKSSTANGAIEPEATCEEMKSDEKDGESNRARDTKATPLVLKGKGTWADVVSKSNTANGTGHKDTAVNGVADKVTVNGVAEE